MVEPHGAVQASNLHDRVADINATRLDWNWWITRGIAFSALSLRQALASTKPLCGSLGSTICKNSLSKLLAEALGPPPTWVNTLNHKMSSN
ncbi:hypothetical protein PIB30_024354 [Stylosanthes scabra]|uniref:Uncharacterized protein n=1 Tax=Stylosanthes scabra TaxID=79078 RepID=A0ABU6QAD7_9FABA|nr:hypothetical protein [Stylosanthes scabra]